MAAFLDLVRFRATAGGTSDFVFSSAIGGCQSPSAANVTNGTVYKWNATSDDLTQWEIFEGAYNTSTNTAARTTVLDNSAGTGTKSPGQSGAGTKISFTVAPQVACIGIKEDLISVEEANSFTATQKAQANKNIFLGPTTQTFTSGTGTYTTPANVLFIEVEMVGGGGGGAGSGTSPGAAGDGGITTFGTTLLTANGGSKANASSGGAGGTASGGFVNKTGASGGNGSGLTSTPGGLGAASPYGGAGAYGAPGGGNGVAAAANTGSGGGGGGVNATVNGGGGGGAGGFLRAIIASPNATYSFAVGAGGTAGTAGTGGANGGGGGSGFIQVKEYYGS